MYTAEFQRYSTKLSWNNSALIHQYYCGLKEHVKDDLSREELPTTLAEMIKRAIQIDNRIYKRTLEKKGLYNYRIKI
jgi:molecular chaperone DnaK (HSP70)